MEKRGTEEILINFDSVELSDKCLHQILCSVRWRARQKMEVIKAFSLAGKLAPLILI